MAKVYPKLTSPRSFIARMDLQPEHLNRPARVALSFLLHTGQLIIAGKTELVITVPCEKNAVASSIVDLILKN